MTASNFTTPSSAMIRCATIFLIYTLLLIAANGLRYLRWGGDGEAVQPEEGLGVGDCLGLLQTPQRQVSTLLGGVWVMRLLPFPQTPLFLFLL